ncbi:sulfotransferase domain-containing protein [Hippea sp. KM1]|uniref:sulfotransferase domain-containing protein n=1 Tax=Hippea sp. KM1 TaxID=944481 RepID=UPI00046CDDDD|nr:sulfotransferase domain-containing protein [Hippea sp. KM1]
MELEYLKIIQIGFPKSGNSLLNKLITLCLKELGVFKTYKNTIGLSYVYTELYKMYNLEELFEDSMDVDDIRVVNDKLYLSFLFPVENLRLVEVQPTALLQFSSLVWSHSKPNELYPFFLNFGVRFYIIRDGRDAINSLIHANTSAKVLKYYPEFKINDAKELYSRLDIFEKYVRMWNDHVENYLPYKEFFTEIRYEKLINGGEDFLKILKIFNLERKYTEFKEILSFKKMKEKSPSHLRKGKIGDWKNYFTEKHKEIFKEIAGDTLIKLGYEKDKNW